MEISSLVGAFWGPRRRKARRTGPANPEKVTARPKSLSVHSRLAEKTSFHRFSKVGEQLFQALALRSAAGDGRNFSPIAPLFGLVHHHLDLHIASAAMLA